MFSPGDTVRLIDEQGQGIVLAVLGNKVWVVMEGLELEFNASQLVKVEFDKMIRSRARPVDIRSKDQAAQNRNKLQKMQPATEVMYELDLHIHELLDRYEHLSNSQILEHQMACCRSFLREARAKKYRRIVLIHGVGEGVLRSEIHRWLDGQTGIEYHDAPYRTYGYGATMVVLHRK